MFAIYVVLLCLSAQTSGIPAGSAAAIIYLVQNVLLLPGLFPIEPLISVACPLSYEMDYELFSVPLIVGALALRL